VLAGLLKNIEPGMLKSIFQVDPFLRLVLKQFVNQVHTFLGKEAFVTVPVFTFYGVLQYFGDVVVVERQCPRQPTIRAFLHEVEHDPYGEIVDFKTQVLLPKHLRRNVVRCAG
jgi:hypothetical protein